jgi:hypothetical protein
VFHLPLTALVDPARRRSALFERKTFGRAYDALGVGDLVGEFGSADESSENLSDSKEDSGQGGIGMVGVRPDLLVDDEIGPGRFGKTEVWGLTGWYLNVLMRRLGIEASK